MNMCAWLEMIIRNGMVGDWTLRDGEFMESFRLPRPGETLETLKRKNPMPGEDRIHFNEASHVYSVVGAEVRCSVTALVHKYSSGFDARAVIEQMQARDSWERMRCAYLRDDGTEMSVEEIMEKWEANGRVQRSRGTLMHYHIEQHLNGATIEKPSSPELEQFLELFDAVLSNYRILRTEAPIFHPGLGVAGQVDCLCLDDSGGTVLWDWKRAKEVRTDNRQQMLPPLHHLPDCNYFCWALQANMYRHILESCYHLKVSRMLLGVMHPLSPRPVCVELPRLEAEIALIVEDEGRDSSLRSRLVSKDERPTQPCRGRRGKPPCEGGEEDDWISIRGDGARVTRRRQVRDTQHCPLGGADKSGLQGAEEERVREDLCIPIQTGEDSRSC